MDTDSSDRSIKLTVISGFPKSGTTLMCSLLDGHPSLTVIPEEHKLLKRVIDKQRSDYLQQALTTVEDFENAQSQSVRARGHNNRSYEDINLQEYKSCLIESSKQPFLFSKLADLFRATLYCYPKRMNMHFVIKDPYLYKNYPILKEWFGSNLCWIHMVRNRDANYNSIKKIWAWKEEKFLQYHALMELILKRLLKEVPHSRIVHYEELVKNTEAVMRNLEAFIGIPHSDIVLQPTFNGHPWGGNSSRFKNLRGVSTRPLGVKASPIKAQINHLQLYKHFFDWHMRHRSFLALRKYAPHT